MSSLSFLEIKEKEINARLLLLNLSNLSSFIYIIFLSPALALVLRWRWWEKREDGKFSFICIFYGNKRIYINIHIYAFQSSHPATTQSISFIHTKMVFTNWTWFSCECSHTAAAWCGRTMRWDGGSWNHKMYA